MQAVKARPRSLKGSSGGVCRRCGLKGGGAAAFRLRAAKRPLWGVGGKCFLPMEFAARSPQAVVGGNFTARDLLHYRVTKRGNSEAPTTGRRPPYSSERYKSAAKPHRWQQSLFLGRLAYFQACSPRAGGLSGCFGIEWREGVGFCEPGGTTWRVGAVSRSIYFTLLYIGTLSFSMNGCKCLDIPFVETRLIFLFSNSCNSNFIVMN